MTDLAPGGARSQTCPRCGRQNAVGVSHCEDCGAELKVTEGREVDRDDLETVEVERAVGAAGFDAEFVVDGDTLTCPNCGHRFTLGDTRVHDAIAATDTATSTAEAGVVTCNCPQCNEPGHAVVGLPEDAPRQEGGVS